MQRRVYSAGATGHECFEAHAVLRLHRVFACGGVEHSLGAPILAAWLFKESAPKMCCSQGACAACACLATLMYHQLSWMGLYGHDNPKANYLMGLPRLGVSIGLATCEGDLFFII